MRKKSIKVSSALLASEKPEMAEPSPDIHELFRHYNHLYFDDALGGCFVTWAPRMRSSIGTCRYIEADHCEIRMSEPLLKHRSSADLKISLLHEMVHAFLWIKEKNKNRSKHGPNFWAMANEINSSCKDDDQRPPNGYNISDQHEFHDEAETSGFHQWMCESCGHPIMREINRGPSPSDCFEKTGHEGDTGNLSSEWHRHNKLCCGRYNKVDISGQKGKQKVVNGVQQNEGRKHTVTRRTNRTQSTDERKDKTRIKRKKKLIDFCSYVTDKPKFSENILKYQRRTSKKKCSSTTVEKNVSYKRKREASLIIPWLGVFTDEESEEEEEPLINKRSVKRMKMKESKGRSGQIGLTPEEIIYLD